MNVLYLNRYYYHRSQSPSHRNFCTTEIGHTVFPQSLIPLVEMLHSMGGNDWSEEIQIGAKLTEI